MLKKKSTEFRTSNKYLSSFADESMNSFFRNINQVAYLFYLTMSNFFYR